MVPAGDKLVSQAREQEGRGDVLPCYREGGVAKRGSLLGPALEEPRRASPQVHEREACSSFEAFNMVHNDAAACWL